MSRRVPPHAYFVVSAVFHYLGPAFAVLLFARVDVLGVAWLRITAAAVIFAVWRRPWRLWRRLDANTRWLLVAWGAVLAVMNSCFYLALDRLPLGTVAAIEFLPVIVLAAFAARTIRNGLALVFAVGGVYLLTDVRLVAEPLGVAFAVANAVLFALYIVLGHRVARSERVPGIDGLAIAMLIAAMVALPIGGWDAVPAFTDPLALAAGVGVGLSSSVIPYVTDQLAMARLSRATYALMVSLLPATATVIGIVVLTQIPTFLEVIGVVLVIAGVAVHQERAAPIRGPQTPAAAPARPGSARSGLAVRDVEARNSESHVRGLRSDDRLDSATRAGRLSIPAVANRRVTRGATRAHPTRGVAMTKYLCLYRGPATPMEDFTAEQSAEQTKAWGEWMGRVGSALVDAGAPFAERTASATTVRRPSRATRTATRSWKRKASTRRNRCSPGTRSWPKGRAGSASRSSSSRQCRCRSDSGAARHSPFRGGRVRPRAARARMRCDAHHRGRSIHCGALMRRWVRKPHGRRC